MKKRVLVTGGAGYIGSHAALALLDAGWEVSVVDDLSCGRRTLIPDSARFFKADVGDSNAMRDILQEVQPQAIMHFAGSILVFESVEQPLEYYRNNTLGSHALITLAVELGIEAFLFSSTAAVYGMPERCPVREDAPLAPINPYGASKMMTERMLLDTATATKLNVGMLRYFNVAGADPQGRSGQCRPEATHLINIASEVLAGKRDKIAIYGTDYPTPDGTCIRDYIHVSDLAAAHVLALEYILEQNTPLIANCGYGRGYSVREVLEIAQQVTGQKMNIVEAERRAGDPPELVADNSRIMSTLDWQPKYDDLGTMISSALEWERNLTRKAHSA
jgi:UDP-glucose 4-epimerase